MSMRLNLPLFAILVPILFSPQVNAEVTSDTIVYLNDDAAGYLLHRTLRTDNTSYDFHVEKSVQLGLLPDVPWENFQFLGNTSVRGAYMALLDREARQRIAEIARSMTYLELSADNSFYDQFTSALFLPHTDITLFPSVAALLERET